MRGVYRMVEFSSSDRSPGYLLRTEWPFWVFDALPMLGIENPPFHVLTLTKSRHLLFVCSRVPRPASAT